MEELKELYPDGLEPLTENTIVDFDELYAQLLQVRETGFSYECEESNMGIRCIATPVRVDGKIAGAVSVVIPIFRYSEQKRRRFESILAEGAVMLEEVLPLMSLASNE
jgi:IclR family KDG regulon transcriptional repressor